MPKKFTAAQRSAQKFDYDVDFFVDIATGAKNEVIRDLAKVDQINAYLGYSYLRMVIRHCPVDRSVAELAIELKALLTEKMAAFPLNGICDRLPEVRAAANAKLNTAGGPAQFAYAE
jgi:hypothetical protein